MNMRQSIYLILFCVIITGCASKEHKVPTVAKAYSKAELTTSFLASTRTNQIVPICSGQP